MPLFGRKKKAKDSDKDSRDQSNGSSKNNKAKGDRSRPVISNPLVDTSTQSDFPPLPPTSHYTAKSPNDAEDACDSGYSVITPHRWQDEHPITKDTQIAVAPEGSSEHQTSASKSLRPATARAHSRTARREIEGDSSALPSLTSLQASSDDSFLLKTPPHLPHDVVDGSPNQEASKAGRVYSQVRKKTKRSKSPLISDRHSEHRASQSTERAEEAYEYERHHVRSAKDGQALPENTGVDAKRYARNRIEKEHKASKRDKTFRSKTFPDDHNETSHDSGENDDVDDGDWSEEDLTLSSESSHNEEREHNKLHSASYPVHRPPSSGKRKKGGRSPSNVPVIQPENIAPSSPLSPYAPYDAGYVITKRQPDGSLHYYSATPVISSTTPPAPPISPLQRPADSLPEQETFYYPPPPRLSSSWPYLAAPVQNGVSAYGSGQFLAVAPAAHRVPGVTSIPPHLSTYPMFYNTMSTPSLSCPWPPSMNPLPPFSMTSTSPPHPVTSSATPPPPHTVTSSATPPPPHTVTSSATPPPPHPVTSSATPLPPHTVTSSATPPPPHPVTSSATPPPPHPVSSPPRPIPRKAKDTSAEGGGGGPATLAPEHYTTSQQLQPEGEGPQDGDALVQIASKTNGPSLHNHIQQQVYLTKGSEVKGKWKSLDEGRSKKDTDTRLTDELGKHSFRLTTHLRHDDSPIEGKLIAKEEVITSLKEEVLQLKNEIARLLKDNQQLTANLRSVEETSAVTGEWQELVEQAEQVAAENVSLQRQQELQRQRLEEMKKEHLATVSQLNAELSRNKKDREAIEKDLCAQKEANLQLQEKLHKVMAMSTGRVSMEEHKEALEEFQRLLEGLAEKAKEDNRTQNHQLKALQKEKKLLVTKLTDAKATILQLEEECTSLHTCNRKAQEKVVWLQRELEESRDREVAAHVHLSSVVMQAEKAIAERDTFARIVRYQQQHGHGEEGRLASSPGHSVVRAKRKLQMWNSSEKTVGAAAEGHDKSEEGSYHGDLQYLRSLLQQNKSDLAACVGSVK